MSETGRDPGGLALFERLAATTDAMVFVTDLEFNTSLWVNEALVEMTGYTLDDYRFERFENPFIPVEDIARVGEFLGAFLASDALVSAGSVRNRFVDRWGGTLHVRSRVAKVTWGDRPALLYCTVLEESEAVSIEVEQRYRSLVEAAADSIVRLRPDLTVHFSNRGFQDLIGKRPVDLRDLVFPELVLDSHQEEVQRQLAGQDPRVSFSAPVRGADGRGVWLEGTFVRISAGPDAGLLQAILRDTTEQRLLDARVAKAQKRETLGQMAGGIAHDLNNILTGILGSATLAERWVEPGGDVAEALSNIRIAAQRAGQLSSSMLAYAGEGNAERVATDLAELVAEMKPLLGSALPKNVRLHVTTPEAIIPVLADEIQLRQVVMNLITNAADATSEGAVEVEAGTRSLDASFSQSEHIFGSPPTDGPVAFVRVRDVGSGMSPEVLRRIFEPFYSTKAVGRGLGLAAVQGILSRHNGCVRVRSEVGVGTEVEVVLPMTDAPIVGRVVAEAQSTPAPGQGDVLVVDDEPQLRSLVRRTLEPVGYGVIEASSGEAALELLKEHAGSVRAVLLDQTMPGMGGDRTLVEIRANHPDLPVVRTSGYVADPELSEPDANSHFLGKPYGVRQLLALVQRILGDAG